MADPLVKDLKPIAIGDPRFVAISSGYPHDYSWGAILKRGKDRNGNEIKSPVCVYETLLISKNIKPEVVSEQTQGGIACFEYH